MNGIPCTVWFDRPAISPHSDEDITGIDEMCSYLEGLVTQEWNDHRIPASRIIVGKNVYNLRLYHLCIAILNIYCTNYCYIKLF